MIADYSASQSACVNQYIQSKLANSKTTMQIIGMVCHFLDK